MSGARHAARKAALRDELHQLRGAVGPAERSRASAAVCQRLCELALARELHTIAGYVAFQNEVELSAYFLDHIERGGDLVLPQITGPGQMSFVHVHDLDGLRPGAYGILEPDGPAVALERIDCFLIPGLAFDLQGRRLGFGGGYYDRALEPAAAGEVAAAPYLVGVGYDWQLRDEALPSDPHDIPVDAVVTDRRIHRVDARHG